MRRGVRESAVKPASGTVDASSRVGPHWEDAMTMIEERAGRTHEALLRRARDLVPLLREHAAQAERERRLTEEVTDALREAGMFTLTAPAPGAGAAVDVGTLVEVTAELARGDGSAGWVALLFNAGAYLTGLLSDRARADVYGPDALATVCGQLTPSAPGRPVADGYVVSGRWAWASGSPQARRSMVTVPLVDGDGELADLRAALIPVDELTVEDTWFAAGMAATASNTFVAEEVFVPEHRTLSLPAVYAGATRNEHPEEVLYRSTTHSALTLAIAGPVIGLARAAFEHVIATVRRGKPIAYSSYARSSDAPSHQLALADAAALIDTAVLHARRSAGEIDAAARAGVQLDGLSRARVRSDMATVAVRCREAVGLLLDVGGASSFASANPVQRVWRDLEVICRHGLVNVALSREIYGKALLGIEPQVTPMV
jgi:alkylation response protein AidB-like acyl-CoA dehydrogenase